MKVNMKRAYEHAEQSDGIRILVDRLWPRGIKKETAKLDHWLKEIAPSTILRKEFHQGKCTFDEFKGKYTKELTTDGSEQKKAFEKLKVIIAEQNSETITLIYSAKDEMYNNAKVLLDILY